MTDPYDPLDGLLALARPQSGEPPEELDDPRNYLVFDRLTSSEELEDPTTAFTARPDGKHTIHERDTVLGIVVGNVDPVTTESVEDDVTAMRSAAETDPEDASAYIPDWTAVSATPNLAPPAEGRFLRRRTGATVRPEWVIDWDGRVAYVPNTYPLSLVGRIFVWTDAASPSWAWWGTASLLGTRTIMTASHVVPWGSGNWKALFIPGYFNDGSIHGPWAASWVTNAHGYSSHSQGDDMAVMRLDVPLGNSLGWFGFETYHGSMQDHSWWTLPGYPWDKDGGNRPWMHQNFPIIDDDNDGAGVELEYRADTEGGQSGAPVWRWKNGSPTVVGTHSGGENNAGEPRQNVAAGGPALTNLLHWARGTWP